ncbi:hypothetical protein HN51_035939 [Arachis hypogaea]|nr:uncharacterized protein DS421_13g412780 [Arachis hypogaea]
MGLEIIEEFRPITPIRTVAASSSSFKHVKDLPNLHTTTITEKEEQEDEEECRTPTSPSQTLTTPLECPPAPKKQRLTLPPNRINKNNNVVAPPSKLFFQVPLDLPSVFVLRMPN